MEETENTDNLYSAGQLLVRCLEAQGVDRLFCVPGESYLEVLDALYDSTIQTIVARQEGGAAMMAEADAKLTGRPGICFVTRGPGAANSMSGVHVAQQDSTPLILFVGQVDRSHVGRDAFQEVDFQRLFGGMAKLVQQVNDPDRLPELLRRAFHVAMGGRPGPVVLVLPEDMLREKTAATIPSSVDAVIPGPAALDAEAARKMLVAAEKPILILGGSRWDHASRQQVHEFASGWGLPVAVSFRRQQLFDALHPNYAGDLSIGANPALLSGIRDSDLVILLGGRLSEIPSQGYTLLDHEPALMHVHADAAELGRVYKTALAVNATPGEFLAALAPPANHEVTSPRVHDLHESFLSWSTPPPAVAGSEYVDLGAVMVALRGKLDRDLIICNGAGNYAAWVHRFFRFREYGSQLAPTAGSMGYGIPAAVAGKLRCPEKTVVCFAGDGCFQMTCQEMGTASQHGAAIIIIVVDNGSYGTIRMHQERRFPGRVSATAISNPDFVALAHAYGWFAEPVINTEAFVPAFDRAIACGQPALLHLKVDPCQLSPTLRLEA